MHLRPRRLQRRHRAAAQALAALAAELPRLRRRRVLELALMIAREVEAALRDEIGR